MDQGIADRYQVLEELGRGSFGVVYKGIEKATGDTVAIKHIDLESSDDDIQEIQGEIACLATCSSSFVTQYKESSLRGHKLWIIMEFLGGGSCLDLLKPGNFTESQIAIVSRELLRGLEYLHNENKIHRDIKAANVLLSEQGRVKLADFGVAAQLTNIKSQRNTFVGTPFWMAPEVIQQDGYSFKADIWSLGITAIELARGEPPLSDVHPMKVLFQIPKNPPPRLEGNFSKEFKDFVALCLVKDPRQRPAAKDLLKHRFIRGAGKVEALVELIRRRKEFDAHEAPRGRHPRYYQETVQNTAPPRDDDDQWVFDTVRSVAPKKTTVRLRKSSAVSARAEESLRKLEVKDSPQPPPSPTPLTVRRRTVKSADSVSSIISEPPPGSPRGSVVPKRPLQPNLSFGNSVSTMRLFRRVPSNGSDLDTPLSTSPEFSIASENSAPPVKPPVEAASKEALLGRRLYSRAIEPALVDMHANALSLVKREALAKLSDAFALLNAVDPEGTYQLMSGMMPSLSGDGKLAATYMPPKPPSEPTPPGTVIIKSVQATPQASPVKLVGNVSTSQIKSHRRRQTELVDGVEKERLRERSAIEAKLPGREARPGLEHCKQLTDVLYDRWVNGLAARWAST